MTVTSKDGHFYYKASPKDEVEPGTTCGLYLITDPERLIEIELIHVDVSCENGGLISVNLSFSPARAHFAFHSEKYSTARPLFV